MMNQQTYFSNRFRAGITDINGLPGSDDQQISRVANFMFIIMDGETGNRQRGSFTEEIFKMTMDLTGKFTKNISRPLIAL